jgi:PPOX class probable F420-dependent enzyme
VSAASPPPSDDAFWQERRICFLTTLRPDGGPHQVPVGATYDPETRIARVITSARSKKVRNLLAAGPGARVSISQAEGRRWCTLEGAAFVRDDDESVAEAERRYAERYKPPRANPERVVIEVAVDRVMGTAKPSGW